eukprot:TRINITY_DN43958_c0_g1_i1.p1 TRINITY_DN43958_c0_g1~~TRINITY_DN43958_c0_g1_i1.p1  ORF type:complete len:253 (+),score=45.76 TRINITY_DN43958_c0_g1_i1:36-761(+)
MLRTHNVRRAFSCSAPRLNMFDFQNEVRGKSPFVIPYDRLNIQKIRQYESGTNLKWYPEVRIVLDMGDEWIPENVKEVMKRKYPIYFDEISGTFTVKTRQGATFEASLEHALDTLCHILYACNRLANRDPSKYFFDTRYYKYKMPLIFRHTEQRWLDKKRMHKSEVTWSTLSEPYGSNESFKIVGGYQPQERPGGHGYHHAATLEDDPYNPSANYTMDPHFINPELAEAKLPRSGAGVSWS